MRILLVIYGSLDSLSGGYLYDKMLVGRLRKEGHEVKVFSQKQRRCYPAQAIGNLDGSLARAAAAFRPDIILEDELNHPSLFRLNRRLKRKWGAPVAGIVHHLRLLEKSGWFAGLAGRLMEPAFLGGLDAFICNSDFTRNSIASALNSRGGVPDTSLRKPSVIALPGSDRLGPASGIGRSSPGGEFRILFLGNIIRRKGLHVLLEALGPLSGEWCLSVAGNAQADEAYTKHLRELAGRLGIGSRVAWLGPVEDGELPMLFADHDLLAVPSQCEGFGIVYGEALAFGLPVIAGALGGASEIITHGENGFLVAWEDVNCLAAILKRLGEDPRELARLKLGVLAGAAGLPRWEDSMKKIEIFLKELAAAGPLYGAG